MKITLIATLAAIAIVSTTRAMATTSVFTDETAYLSAIASQVRENFDGPAWDGVRTSATAVAAADAVTSSGITWTTAVQITTSQGPARSGWAVYSSPHTTPDTIAGTSTVRLYGVGGWLKTNTPQAKIRLTLDAARVVDFNEPIIDTQHQFFGVIDTAGFQSFSFSEIEGTTIEPRQLFGDDFTVAIALANDGGPSADGGTFLTTEIWAKAILEVPGNPVVLVWQEVGADTTLSGDRVISGYFYADPNDFAYGSPSNPEVFVKVYIAANGWCNLAFNHVTVDDVSVFSAHNYTGSPDASGTVALDKRLEAHQYSGVGQQ